MLVCSYFGPETSSGVTRVNSFAQYWLELGCDIDVITMPFSEELPDSLKSKKNLNVHEVSPFFAFGKIKKSQCYSSNAGKSSSFLKKLIFALKRKIFANYLDPRTLWWPRAVKRAIGVIDNKKIDVLFTSVPSYTATSVGALLKWKYPKLFWVADYRDLWHGNPAFPGSYLFRSIERIHETFLVKKADFLVTINDSMATILKDLHNKNISVIPNGFHLKDVNLNKIYRKNKRKRLTIVYTGTVIPDYQNPEPLFSAVASLLELGDISNTEVQILFYGNSSGIKKTKNYDLLIQRDILILKGRVSRASAIEAQRDADLLLLLGAMPKHSQVVTDGVVTSKVFEYLVSGTEVMAVGVSKQMIVAEVIASAQAGYVYGEDIDLIKKKILDCLENGLSSLKLDFEYLERFNRKNLALSLMKKIELEYFRVNNYCAN